MYIAQAGKNVQTASFLAYKLGMKNFPLKSSNARIFLILDKAIRCLGSRHHSLLHARDY